MRRPKESTIIVEEICLMQQSRERKRREERIDAKIIAAFVSMATCLLWQQAHSKLNIRYALRNVHDMRVKKICLQLIFNKLKNI